MWFVRPDFRGLAAEVVPAACMLAIVVAPACARSLGEGARERSQEEPAVPAGAQEGVDNTVEQRDLAAEASRLGELWRQSSRPSEELLSAATELGGELRRRAGLSWREAQPPQPPATGATAAPAGPVEPSAAPTPPREAAARERATDRWMTVSPPEELAPGEAAGEANEDNTAAWRRAVALLDEVEAAWRAEAPDREAIAADLAELEALLGTIGEAGGAEAPDSR